MSGKSSPKTIQQQIDELNQLMEWFEQDDVDVEEALKQFEKADKLAAEIGERLSVLENKVTVLKERFDVE